MHAGAGGAAVVSARRSRFFASVKIFPKGSRHRRNHRILQLFHLATLASAESNWL